VTPLLAPIALLLVYALLTMWLSVIDGERARARNRRTERTFEAAGLELTKAPPLWTVEGGPTGGRVTVTRVLSQPLPGGPLDFDGDPETTSGLLATFDDDGPDLFVAAPPRILRCMGPVPGVPRQPTGHPTFDARYEVRAAAPLEASPQVLDTLLALDPHWIHRTGNRTGVMVGRTAPESVEPLVDALLAWRERSERAVVRLPPETSVAGSPLAGQPTLAGGLLAGWGLAFFFALPLGLFLLTFVAPVRSLTATVACPPGVGARMTVSDEGGCNRSYGVRCENGDDIGTLGVTTAALQGAAILVSLGGLVSLRRLGS
jgi:hypothetical protein